MKRYLNSLIPRTIEVVDSPLNGRIEVVQFLNQPRIIVNKMIQSGGMVKTIWQKGVKRLESLKLNIQTVLILGLGGGTVAKLISRSFPQAQITGIEIDPLMINLGKKYFALNKIKGLKIINKDALRAVSNLPKIGGNYCLIIVDLYLGASFPSRAETKDFLDELKQLVSPQGRIVFNRLFYQEKKKETEKFIKKLDHSFSDIELVRAWSNLLIFCQS